MKRCVTITLVAIVLSAVPALAQDQGLTPEQRAAAIQELERLVPQQRADLAEWKTALEAAEADARSRYSEATPMEIAEFEFMLRAEWKKWYDSSHTVNGNQMQLLLLKGDFAGLNAHMSRWAAEQRAWQQTVDSWKPHMTPEESVAFETDLSTQMQEVSGLRQQIAQVQATIDRQLKSMPGRGIPSTILNLPQANPNAPRLVRTGTTAATYAGGFAGIAAGYLAKEGIEAIATGNPERFSNAVAYVKSPAFWIPAATFTSTAVMTRRALNSGIGQRILPPATAGGGLASTFRGALRGTLPLAAGVAALEYLNAAASGQPISAGTLIKNTAITTAGYGLANVGVQAVGTRLLMMAAPRFFTAGIYAPLLAAGPVGWVGAGVLFVAQTAITMYLGEKISGWLGGLFGGGDDTPETESAAPARETRDGLKSRIDAIGID